MSHSIHVRMTEQRVGSRSRHISARVSLLLYRLSRMTLWIWVVRALTLLFLAPSALVLSSASAEAASPAENFVQNDVNAGFAILNDVSLPKDEKNKRFRAFLLSLTNLNRVADYALGPEKNTVSPNDLREFEDAFRDYALVLYEMEFNKYSGQTLRVTGEIPLGTDVSIVTTQLINSHGSTPRNPTEVDFRVFGTAGSFTVGDVTVLGVDLAITAQDQVQTFLWQHHNDIVGLTVEFRRRAAQMRADN